MRGLPKRRCPLRGRVVGHRPGLGSTGAAFACPPGVLGDCEALVVACLGDVGTDPGEVVQRTVAAHVVVVEGVELSAQLMAFGGWAGHRVGR